MGVFPRSYPVHMDISGRHKVLLEEGGLPSCGEGLVSVGARGARALRGQESGGLTTRKSHGDDHLRVRAQQGAGLRQPEWPRRGDGPLGRWTHDIRGETPFFPHQSPFPLANLTGSKVGSSKLATGHFRKNSSGVAKGRPKLRANWG